MSDNTPMAGHYRDSYGEVLKNLIIVMFGMGVEPHRIRMERAANPTHPTRAQFDILLRAEDNTLEYLFESKTVEELKTIAVMMDLTKELVLNNHNDGKLVLTEKAMFDQPDADVLRFAIQGSFDENFAKVIVPTGENSNNMRSRMPMQQAASVVSAPERQKNPNRVAGGRKAMAKRWGSPPVASNSVQTTAPKD